MTRDNAADADLIEEKKLSNSVHLRLFDRSRQVAGDRWLIRLQGEARVAVDPAFFAAIEEGDSELLGAVRKRLGDELVFSLEKERHFVAEAEKRETVAALLAQVGEHMLAYLASPTFPEKLFRRRYQGLKTKILIEREQERRAAAEVEEDDGPADFSFCFRDCKPGK